MSWTTVKPTKPGWYWYKGEDPDIEFHADGIAIVEVIKEEDRLVCRHSNGAMNGSKIRRLNGPDRYYCRRIAHGR